MITCKNKRYVAGDNVWDVFLDNDKIGVVHEPRNNVHLLGKFYFKPVDWETANWNTTASSIDDWISKMNRKQDEFGGDLL